MAYVVSNGVVRELGRPASMPVASVQLAADFTADYAQIWRTQGAVRTVVDFLGRNIASLGLHLYRRVDDTDRERLTDHPAARLLSKPNPRTTRYRLIDALVRDLGIYDRAYWLKMNDSGTPALLRLPPAKVTPIGTNWMWPEAFGFSAGGKRREFPADQVVHFRGYAPEGDLAGSSPIESLRRVLAEEYEAGRMREQILRNGARASGYLERPAGAPTWSETAANRFRQSWQSQYSGNGPGAGGTPILEDGMKFVAASQTSEQLQYVETRKLTREEVAAAYFIPPTMVGVMDSATFSNIREQHKHLYQDTLGPLLSMIAEELALQLLPDFEDTEGLYFEFNMAEKLRGSFEEQASQLQASVGGPYMTRNEARARMNLPRIEDGDELITPLNVLVGGQASPQDSAPPEAGAAAGPLRGIKAADQVAFKAEAEPSEADRDEAVEMFAAFFRRQRQAVLSAIGAGGDWWDGDRWARELSADLAELALKHSAALGAALAEELGGAYSVEQTTAFLEAVAESRARWVNEATKAKLEAALAAEDEAGPEAVFTEAENQRAPAAGGALVAAVASFAVVEAVRQNRGRRRGFKTWRTTSKAPRSTHARVAGERVGIDDRFSNGMAWPGDPAGGADEVAGCMCTVTVEIED